MIAVGQCSVGRDSTKSNQLCKRLLNRQHAFRASRFDNGAELMIVASANQVPYSACGDKNLNGWVAIDPIRCRKQALMDDCEKSQRKLATNLGLEVRREY